MRAVFLDFDGVLNSWDYASRAKAENIPGEQDPIIDPAAVAVLNAILVLTHAKVVISSSWRHRSEKWVKEGSVEEFCGWLKPFGFTGEIISAIDDSLVMAMRHQRGDTIKAWLDWHTDVTEYVVLDDSEDMDAVRDRWVYINPDHGLLASHVPDILTRFGVRI
jgi:hypothetical protein